MWRLRFEVDLEDRPFFFDEAYKINLSQLFKAVLNGAHFVFSDIVPLKKKTVHGGFWALKQAALFFTTPLQDSLSTIVTRALKTPLDFRYGSLKFKRAVFQKVRFETTGYLISPVSVLLPTGESMIWEREPERYSEALRHDLIKKYENLYGEMPEDNRFFFSFVDGYEKEETGDGFISYRGKFTVFGSKELITVAYLCGIGNLNEMGYGMITHEEG
ncbi:MAG: CRISPR-associated endoribonuclease Cas6 [Bacillota bacterium]|nr:MAG: hypothetical protein DIU66_08950 [Bacillota bacterium]